MKKQLIVLTMLIGFSIVLINGCSKSSSDSATPAVTSPLAGTFKVTTNGLIFVLNLNADFSYSFTHNNNNFDGGNYTLTVDTIITFVSNFPASGNSCLGQHGKYIYKSDTDTTTHSPRLTLALLSDSCASRVSVAIGKWIKQ